MWLDFIESLHDRVKDKYSGVQYIVAPASRCDPSLFQDIVRLGRNAYFILRVPFSAIEALHGRVFDLVDQPNSESGINDATESFGFSFVRVPTVQSAVKRTRKELTVELREFIAPAPDCRAMGRSGLEPGTYGL